MFQLRKLPRDSVGVSQGQHEAKGATCFGRAHCWKCAVCASLRSMWVELIRMLLQSQLQAMHVDTKIVRPFKHVLPSVSECS